MTNRKILLSAFALVAVLAAPALMAADEMYNAVVHDVRGNAVKDARGNCVRTEWAAETEECDAAPAARPHEKLASVYFDFNKAILTPKSRADLNALLKTLKDKHIDSVVIAGYADAVGSDSYNLRLSQKRAQSVLQYLKVHGFSHASTDIRALGKSEASAKCNGLKDGKLHACMQEDRRVDIEVEVK